uniref:Chromatin remodeling complex ATPase n=1 Tax=Myoviridae sp. ctp7F23 TaxID=2825174 RepID=A0A8S5U8J5_9CAUD|nr:MAG TPA: Chromatin remodeling complex ATPase [Myoviridae sp. ctp7F23]
MGKVERLLIVAPTSVVAVWPKELQEYAKFKYTCKTLLGEKKQRLKQIDDLIKFPFKALKVAVINYESTWRPEILEKLKEFDADMVIADESQRIKTVAAAQSKAMHELGDQARYKLILSGTPVQTAAIDIWSQYRFLDKSVFGDNFFKFRGRYAIMGGYGNKKIVGYKDLEGLIKKEHSIAFRVTKDEALDLPEQTFETRKIQFNQKEKNLYERIKKDSYAELDGGGHITATTVLTRLLRLQQLAGGFLVQDDAQKPQLVSRAKLDALADIIEDYVIGSGKKLVIFARFIAEVKAIMELAGKVLPKELKQVAIYGDIKKEDRGGIVKQFQEDPNTVLFIGQIDTAGTGITLTAADTCVYYSKNFNYATYSQSLSRIHRIGQRNCCTYIDLEIEGTIDELISKALSRKEDMAKTVVDNWRDFF